MVPSSHMHSTTCLDVTFRESEIKANCTTICQSGMSWSTSGCLRTPGLYENDVSLCCVLPMRLLYFSDYTFDLFCFFYDFLAFLTIGAPGSPPPEARGLRAEASGQMPETGGQMTVYDDVWSIESWVGGIKYWVLIVRYSALSVHCWLFTMIHEMWSVEYRLSSTQHSVLTIKCPVFNMKCKILNILLQNSV